MRHFFDEINAEDALALDRRTISLHDEEKA